MKAPTFFLALLVGLSLGSATAQAGPVPPISDTAEFRSLAKYVSLLKENQAKPISDENRAIQSDRLLQRRDAARSKVASLYREKKKRIQARGEARFAKVRNKRRAAVAAERRSLKDKIVQSKADTAEAIGNRRSEFVPSLREARSELQAFQEKLRNTTKPAMKKKLRALIAESKDNLQSVQDEMKASLNRVRARGRQAIDRLQAESERRVLQITNRFRNRMNEVRADWKTLSRALLRDARLVRKAEYGKVSGQYQQGVKFIRARPPVPVPPLPESA